jgi:lipid II:glycine glycyltransferase (peptidoglycan interpeptide bridge formation enzyme)
MKMIKKQSVFHPLQSGEWGKFRKVWGNKILWTNYGLVTIHQIPFTKYSVGMFIKGPEPTKEMLDELRKLGVKENLIFIKLEPNVPTKVNSEQSTVNGENSKKSEHRTPNTEHAQKLVKLLRSNGVLPGKTLFTPTTFWIDLTRPEEEILKSFSSKTRYNIRLAQKYGVVVKEDNSEKAFDKYLKLTRETVERQGFYAHTEKYHRLMWKYLHSTPITEHRLPIAHLLTATYKKEAITAWVVFLYKDILYYPYGASSEAHKQVMANNLMMWEAIKFGKKMGAKTFDLWGREEGKGFTKFKEGYSPQVVEFLGTWDLVINPVLYKVYRILEKLRWKFLRLRAKVFPVKPTF